MNFNEIMTEVESGAFHCRITPAAVHSWLLTQPHARFSGGAGSIVATFVQSLCSPAPRLYVEVNGLDFAAIWGYEQPIYIRTLPAWVAAFVQWNSGLVNAHDALNWLSAA